MIRSLLIVLLSTLVCFQGHVLAQGYIPGSKPGAGGQPRMPDDLPAVGEALKVSGTNPLQLEYGPVGTGDLQSGNNLSDLDDPQDARVNLGLGSAAASDIEDFEPSGTATGLVDDLSGVSDKSAARANLELGTAAVKTSDQLMRDALDITDYGAIPNDNLDDAAAIQACIDAAMAGGKSVYVPGGTFDTDSPILVIKHSGDKQADPVTFCMFGTQHYPYAASTGTVSRINCRDKDGFAIGVQLAKGVRFLNLYITGQNDLLPTMPSPKAMVQSNETTDWAVNGCRDELRSPHSGILVDPFGTSAGVDPYPGYEDWYVQASGGSTSVEIDNCRIEKFVCCVGVSVSGQTSNADHIRIRNCRIEQCKVACGFFQAQCRGNAVEDLNCTQNTLYVFDGYSYGAQQGVIPNVRGGVLAGSIKYVFNNRVNATSNANVQGLFAETFYSLGECSHGMNFNGCHFKMSTSSTPHPTTFYTNPARPTNFTGCELWASVGPADSRKFLFNCKALTFNSCTFDLAPYVPFSAGSATKVTQFPRFHNCFERTTGTWVDIEAEQQIGVNSSENVSISVDHNTETATFTTAGGIWEVGEHVVTYSNSFHTDEFRNSYSYASVGKITAIDGTTVTIGKVPETFPSGTYWLGDHDWTPKKVGWTRDTGPFVIDADKEISLKPFDSAHTLNSADNQILLDLNYGVGKAASGTDTGLRINKTPLGPGSADTSLLLDGARAGVSQLAISSLGDIRFKEKSDHELTPTAGHHLLWVKDDNRLYFTDDAGTDHDLLAGGGRGGAVTALNNQAENRLVTIGSATTELDGEAGAYFDGTDLGIGTSTPSLGFSGSHVATEIYAGAGVTPGLRINNDGDYGEIVRAGALGLFAFYMPAGTDDFTIYTNNNRRMTILDTGRIGFGVIAPTAVHEINAATATDPGLIVQTTDNSTANKLVDVQSSTGASLYSISGTGSVVHGAGLSETFTTPGKTNQGLTLADQKVMFRREIAGSESAGIRTHSSSNDNSVQLELVTSNHFYFKSAASGNEIAKLTSGSLLAADAGGYFSVENISFDNYVAKANISPAFVSDDAAASDVGMILGRSSRVTSDDDADIVRFQYDDGDVGSVSTTGNLDMDGDVTAGGNITASAGLVLAGEVGTVELSADPADPPAGQNVKWQSDGTGSGDDGDIMMKITDSQGTTKTITLVDFSAF